MKRTDLPQDGGLFDGMYEVQYAVDENGRYVLEKSAGWEPKAIANSQFWRSVEAEVLESLEQVRSGRASPLRVYMALHQMDVGLLASHARLWRWQVRRHLKPRVFAGLKPDTLQRYAKVFNVPAEWLVHVPENWEKWDFIRQLAHRYDPGDSVMHLKYEHRHSAHCESGVTSGLLSHHGLPLTEAMAFGIGSGLFFAYLPFLRIGSLPLTTYRSYPGQVFAKATTRLGVQVRRQRFRDPDAAMAALDELLERGHPVGCQTGIYWLPYFPPGMRFHFNVHNIVIYGREGTEYLISDPVLEKPVRCAREDLIRARFAPGPMSPRGHLYFVTQTPAATDRSTAVLTGIKDTCSAMSLPVVLFGYRGIRFLARRVAGWQERLGSHRAAQHLGNLIRMQEEIGTGGGGFRFIFAKFLQEAAEMLKEPRLEECSSRMTAIGDRWREFALMASRNCKGRAHETESYAALADILRDCGNREREFFQDLSKLVGELRRPKQS